MIREKHIIGRPPKYKKDMCVKALECLKQGKSIAGLAGELGVSRETIYEWKKTHTDFSDAIKIGLDFSLAWWENILAGLARGEHGNVTAAIFVLKNRWHNEYKDRVENNISVSKVAPEVLSELEAVFEQETPINQNKE